MSSPDIIGNPDATLPPHLTIMSTIKLSLAVAAATLVALLPCGMAEAACYTLAKIAERATARRYGC